MAPGAGASTASSGVAADRAETGAHLVPTDESAGPADILHDLPIFVPRERVFAALTTPEGLDQWWTLGSSGEPVVGSIYALDFGPEYRWRARVTRCDPDLLFELEMETADEDWRGTRLTFELADRPDGTKLRFSHSGWPRVGDHYRTSAFCWAMYLRILKRWLEHGETVPYAERLDA
jgi:uncharacterized protein YndB with AHSA1/START domain